MPLSLKKDRIDIIIESPNPTATIEPLTSLGFEYMGEFNIPFHCGFRRHTGVEVNLHVYEPGHAEIALNLTFRDALLKCHWTRNDICPAYPTSRHIYCMFYIGGEIVGYAYITKRSPNKYTIKKVYIE